MSLKRTALLSLAMLALAGCAVRPVAPGAGALMPAATRGEAGRQLIVTIREAEHTLSSAPGRTPRSYGGGAPYGASPYARHVVAQLEREYGLIWVADWRIDVLGVHCVVFQARDDAARAEAVRRLQQDERVESVQPMQSFRTAAGGSRYNDPYFRLQTHVTALQVPEAHLWSRGRGVRIAVIDTGVALEHPELAGRVRVARNFVDEDEESFRRDTHGTAVAGVIAAAVNNGIGIVGIAPEVELLALKACWHEAPGEPAVCNTLTLAEALDFAIRRKAAVINLSLTGPDDPLLRRLVEAALQRGTAVVAADGGRGDRSRTFPLSIPGVLAVGDADSPDSLASAPLVAPGREILTLTPSGRYDYMSGASLSTAMVSGIVALLLERRRDLQPRDVADLLSRTAAPLQPSSIARLVNACGAVLALVGAGRCGEPEGTLASVDAALPQR